MGQTQVGMVLVASCNSSKIDTGLFINYLFLLVQFKMDLLSIQLQIGFLALLNE